MPTNQTLSWPLLKQTWTPPGLLCKCWSTRYSLGFVSPPNVISHHLPPLPPPSPTPYFSDSTTTLNLSTSLVSYTNSLIEARLARSLFIQLQLDYLTSQRPNLTIQVIRDKVYLSGTSTTAQFPYRVYSFLDTKAFVHLVEPSHLN